MQFPADLVTFTEEILNGKLHFLYSVGVGRNNFKQAKKEMKLNQKNSYSRKIILPEKLNAKMTPPRVFSEQLDCIGKYF